MQKRFSCRPLLIVICLLILFKFCAIFANALVMANLNPPDHFLDWLTSPSYMYPLFFIIGVKNETLAIWLCVLLLVLFFAQLIPLILLAINGRSAGASSIVLLVYCIPDLCVLLLYTGSYPTYVYGALYNLVVIVLLILLRHIQPRRIRKTPTKLTEA